jgi:hypothetical protein
MTAATLVEPTAVELRTAVLAMSPDQCQTALLILLGSATSKTVRRALALACGIEPTPIEPEPEPVPVKAEPTPVPEVEPKPLAASAVRIVQPAALHRIPAIPPDTFEDLKADPDAYRESVLSLELGARAFEALQDPKAEVPWCGNCLAGTEHTIHSGVVGQSDGVKVCACWEPSGSHSDLYEPVLRVLPGPNDNGFFLDRLDAEAFARLMDTFGRQALADIVRLGIALIADGAK